MLRAGTLAGGREEGGLPYNRVIWLRFFVMTLVASGVSLTGGEVLGAVACCSTTHITLARRSCLICLLMLDDGRWTLVNRKGCLRVIGEGRDSYRTVLLLPVAMRIG